MLKRLIQSTLCLAMAAAVAGTAWGQAATQPAEKLVDVIKAADSSHKAKADALRQLAQVGTKDSVPAIAALLGDETLGHMARFALEPIPDPSVDAALRDALGRLQGMPLVGVIGSVGVRRDAKAINQLAGFLGNPDPVIAQAAARALGKIGTQAAADAILAALSTTAEANQVNFCEGLFRCAEAMAAAGQKDQAMALYDRMRSMTGPAQVRAGGLRGAILIRGGKQGAELIRQHLKSEDPNMLAAAVRASYELPGPEVTAVLLAEVQNVGVDHQVMLIQAISKRGESSVITPLAQLAGGGNRKVRLAAVRALAEVGMPQTVPVLGKLMEDKDQEISQAAQEALASVAGREADQFVLSLVNGTNPDFRTRGMDLAVRRRMTTVVPVLLKAATDPDARMRSSALRRLGELGSVNELPALTDLLLKAQEGGDVDAVEQALTSIIGKAEKPEVAAAGLGKLLPQARPAQQSAILRVLSTVGGADALNAVRGVIADANADKDVRATAIRSLGTWKTADAAPDLLKLAQNAPAENEKVLGLRSYIRMAARKDLPVEARLKMCKDVVPLVQRDDEKKALISALQNIGTADVLAMMVPYLDQAGTREEAATAIVTTVDNLTRGRNAPRPSAETLAAIEKAAATVTEGSLGQRAKAVLQQARNKARQ